MDNASRYVGAVAVLANGSPTRNAKPRSAKHDGPREPYKVAAQSGREATRRLQDAQKAARAEGRRVAPSCSDVLIDITGQLAGYSRCQGLVSIRGIATRTGLTLPTVRAAMRLLESFGCLSRFTPENVPGTRTGKTLIALPIVDPTEDHDHDPEAPDRATAADGHPGKAWTNPTPGKPGLTRPRESLDYPPSRSRTEKKDKGGVSSFDKPFQPQLTVPPGYERTPVPAWNDPDPNAVPPPTALAEKYRRHKPQADADAERREAVA